MLDRWLDGDELVGNPGSPPESSGGEDLYLPALLNRLDTTEAVCRPKAVCRQNVHLRGVQRAGQGGFEDCRESDSAMGVASTADVVLRRVGNRPTVIAPFWVALADVLWNSNAEVADRDRNLAPRFGDSTNRRISPERIATVVDGIPQGSETAMNAACPSGETSGN